jgi:hypothetical protein
LSERVITEELDEEGEYDGAEKEEEVEGLVFEGGGFKVREEDRVVDPHFF